MANNPDYEVGWGRPPKHTQWKKGGPSPNPNGRRGKKGKLELGTSSRPKTARDQLSDEVLAELNSLVKIQGKDGKVEEITKYRAMFRKWVNEALTLPTSAASRKLLTDIAQQAAEDDLAAQQGWIDFLKGYKTAEEQKLRAHDKRRLELKRMGERDIGPWPEAIPHPYNIVTNDFTQDYGVYGPVSEDEYRLEDEFLSQCGHAMMTMHQSVEAYKMAVSDEERKLHKVAIEHARSIWLHYNAKLSLRFRRSPSELAQFDLSERPVPEQDDF